MLPYSHVAPDASTLLSPAAGLLRVAIAGSDPLARAGLASILGAFDDVSVIADDIDLDDSAETRLNALTPDVVVCDLGTADGPPVRFSVPSLLLVREAADTAELIATGTRGVVDRSATPNRLHAAVRAIDEGLLVIDTSISRSPSLRDTEMAEPLTAREREVLQLLSAGLTNKEIAHRLGITEHTVKFHVNAILGKLAAETRTEAVVQAARRGLIVL